MKNFSKDYQYFIQIHLPAFYYFNTSLSIVPDQLNFQDIIIFYLSCNLLVIHNLNIRILIILINCIVLKFIYGFYLIILYLLYN
jgi:hypothetical protein